MFLSLCTLAIIPWQASIESESGLCRVEFADRAGRITVYLPEDVRNGDLISGTVLAEPAKGASLSGTVVTINGRETSVGAFTITLDGKTSLKVSVGGTEVLLPVDRAARTESQYGAPPVAQVGRPLQITGPFDGDASTTRVLMGNAPCLVLAESPRSVIVFPATRTVGSTKVEGAERGSAFNLATSCTDLKMVTGSRTLLKGTRTPLKVEVSGLGSVPESAYPISLELHNLSPTVVQLSGLGGNHQAIAIQFAEVKQGVWSRTLDVVGLSGGPYVITGVLFAVNIHGLKMMLDEDQLAALIDSNIASTQAKKDKKVKEGANDWTINQFKKKLETLQNARESLPDLGAARDLFDKALADFTFFEMAGELIDFAAEMLGYKDLPLPGIGHALKALKIAAKKAPKAIELLEKAEKIVEMIGEIEDGAEKLKKAMEAKELLDKVKKELAK